MCPEEMDFNLDDLNLDDFISTQTETPAPKIDLSNIVVKVADDRMAAYIMLKRPEGYEGDLPYTVEDVVQALNAKGVVYGIDTEKIKSILSGTVYLEPPAVALGVAPEPSIPGRYEYFFSTEVNKAPKVLEDGTVDYLSVDAIPVVHEGDTLARYIPSVQGRPGRTVTGLEIPIKRVPDLPPLRGKGFTRSSDGLLYTASTTGKISMVNGRIVVSNVYEVGGDADISTGNIDFRGDVIIHGAVRDGITIKASGSITVNGIVEGAQLDAGSDIVLRQGLIGNSKAKIRCKGNLTAKFIEFCYVEVEGNISAESFMESEIYCYSNISLEGAKGRIIGGTTVAIEGVSARFIGNPAGVPTWVRVGADAELKYQVIALQKKIEATQSNLDRVEEGMAVLAKLESMNAGDPEDTKMKKMQLTRVKIRDSSIMASDRLEMERLQQLIIKGQGASIKVQDTIYAGSNVKVGDYALQIKKDDVRCGFIESEQEIRAIHF